MQVLKIDMKRFYAGFKVGEILDPYMSGFKEKYVNNEYLEHFNDNYSEYHGVTELQRLQFLLSGIEINAKAQESKVNPYFRDYFSSYSKSFLFDLAKFRKGEKINDEILFYLYFLYKDERELFDKEPLISKLSSEINVDFIEFFITVINSLYLDNVEINKEDPIPPFVFVGFMDKINSNKYKKEKLSFRQKYVVISKLIYLYFKKNKINNKDLLESGLHYIIWRLIERTDAECDYLQKIGKEGGYAATFLNSKLFRSPMSMKAVKDMFSNIEQMYREREKVERLAAREVFNQIMEKKPLPEKKRKEWKKQAFVDTLKKYHNQSSMARAYGISRQRISELKKKFKVKDL